MIYRNEWQPLRTWIVERPWQPMLLMLVLFLIAAAGIPRLTTTTDYRAFFGPDNPDLKAQELYESRFEQTESHLIGIEVANDDLFTPENLMALREMTDEAWHLLYAMRVNSIANYQHTRADGDDIIVEPLVPKDTVLTAADAQRIRRIALNSDELINSFVSETGHAGSLTVQVKLPRKNLQTEGPESRKELLAFLQRYEQKYPQFTFHPSGIIMLNQALSDSMRRDLGVLFPIGFLVTTLILILYFRRLAPAGMIALINLMSAMSAFGFAGWIGITLNPVSSAAGLVVMTLAVADCVHVLVSYQQARAAGNEPRPALLDAIRINLGPIFITSVTTAIGFLALNFSDAPPFRDMGNMVAFGVLFAFLLSIFLLPALLVWFPGKAIVVESFTDRIMPKLGEFVIRHNGKLLIGMTAFVVLLMSGISQNRFGDNYAEYFDESIPFRAHTEFIDREVAGMQAIQYTVTAPEPGAVNDPEFLKQLEKLTLWLESQPEVRKVNSLGQLHKRLNQTMHGDDPAWHRVPDSRELAAQYLFFYELSLPRGLSINNVVDADRQRLGMILFLNTIEAHEMLAFDARVQTWAEDNLPEDMLSRASGLSTLFALIGKRNFNAMLVGMAVALVLISALLLFMLRSLRIGLISLVPNLIPGLMAFGLWGYLTGHVGMALAVVGSMSLGIIVDDTVHLLSKFLRARRELQLDVENAVRYAFKNVGAALVLTSVILVCTFGMLAFSSFQQTAHMGIFTSMTIILALVADFLLLPPLLLRLFKRD